MKRMLLICMLLCLSGCGYTTGSLLSSSYRTLHVSPFENKVAFLSENSQKLYVPLLETKVRNAIIDRFQLDGHLRLSDSDRSDLILKGELTAYERDDLRTDQSQNVLEYRLRIIVSLTMTDNTTGQIFWQEPSFVGESTYFTSGTQAKSEAQALNDTLTDLARRVVERTVENW